MLKIERRLLEFIEIHIHFFFTVAVLIFGCSMRLSCFHFVSNDASECLLEWYKEIANGAGIARQVGNYNIPYQILIYLMTKLPLNPLTDYKALSCAFDLALAALAGLLAWEFFRGRKERARMGCLAFALVFCHPVVILNSAVWAQCDSIYTFFGIAAILLFYKEKYIWSFAVLGVSFAFKLQAVFFLPFFLIGYVCRKRFSILNFAGIPIMMAVLSLPALLAGRDILDLARIYRDQTHVYDVVYVNFPNLYPLLTDISGAGNYTMFRWLCVSLAVVVLGIGLYLCASGKVVFSDRKVFWGIAVWSIYSCVMFLPNMHERYGYALEVLLILYSFLNPAVIPAAVTANLLPLVTYGNYLFGYKALSLPILSLFNVAAYAFVTYMVFHKQQSVSVPQGICHGQGSE